MAAVVDHDVAGLKVAVDQPLGGLGEGAARQMGEFRGQRVETDRHFQITVQKSLDEIAAFPLHDQIEIIGCTLAGPGGVETRGSLDGEIEPGVDDRPVVGGEAPIVGFSGDGLL